MKAGDLVLLNWGECPELECVKPNEWFAVAVRHPKPMIFLEWCEEQKREIADSGWAVLLHPDGSKKIVHNDYFVRVRR